MRFRAAEPGAPQVHLGFKRAWTGNGDVFALERIDKRGEVEAFNAFPGCLYGREVKFGFVLEQDFCAFRKEQPAIALEMDGAAEPLSSRYLRRLCCRRPWPF